MVKNVILDMTQKNKLRLTLFSIPQPIPDHADFSYQYSALNIFLQ